MRKLGVALTGFSVVWAGVLALPVLARARDAAGESASRLATDDAGAAISATMTCAPVDSPGRVRCDVEARVASGESLAWGDIVIVRTPPFVSALRGRIGPGDTTAREPGAWRWALALVARSKGAGDVEARVRLVVCRSERCSPREVDVTGHVLVGEPGPSALEP